LIYDALGQMVEQQNGSTYTQMLYSQIGKTAIMNGQTLSKAFVALPGGGTAIYNSTGLAYYRHTDWLGSSRLTSTPARAVHSDSAYAPFGEEYTKSGSDDPSFTGQNADTSSTLYDFTFREYSPSQGRWVSPDPARLAVANLSAPQSWNRYAYVLNDPLRAIDPDELLDRAGLTSCEQLVIFCLRGGVVQRPGDLLGGAQGCQPAHCPVRCDTRV
jgi:RHS repeat-associated protein